MGDRRLTLYRRLLAIAKSPMMVYLGAAVLARVGPFLLIPLYTRRLSLKEYGDYALFLTLISFLSTFLSVGLSAALSKLYFSEKRRDAGKAQAGQAARWLMTLTLGLATVLGLAASVLWPEAGTELNGRWSVVLAIGAGAGMAIGQVPWVLLRAEQRPYPAAAFQLLQFVATTILGFVLVGALERDYRGAIEASAFAQIISGVAGILFILKFPSSPMRVALLRRAAVFALPFLPHFVAQWTMGAASRWVLRGSGHEDDVGSFSLASQAVTPVNMVVMAWNDTANPQMGEHFRDGGLREMRQALPKMRNRYLWAMAVPGVLLCSGLPLVALLVGESFRSALFLVPLILLTIIPDAFYMTHYHILYYTGRTKTLGMATVASATVNVLVNLALVPWFSVAGVLTAAAIAQVTRAAIVRWASQRAYETPANASSETGNQGDERHEGT